MDANTALTSSVLQASPDPPRHQLYNPRRPYFDQTWQPSEIEPI